MHTNKHQINLKFCLKKNIFAGKEKKFLGGALAHDCRPNTHPVYISTNKVIFGGSDFSSQSLINKAILKL